MARVEQRAGQRVVVAESAAERALVARGHRHDRLVLEEAYYAVRGEVLSLPEGASQATAERIAIALTAAAERHGEAERRRRGFRPL